MSFGTIALLLFAALLHAGWNLLLKQAGETYIVAWWALLVGALCFVPLWLVGVPLPPQAWGYALVSAVCQAAYFMTLSAAYRRGDFSLVYPIARGAAPALLALWSVLFLNELPGAGGLLGLLLVVLGLALVGGGAWRTGAVPQRHGSDLSIGLALLVALCISFYSAIDGAAARFVDPATYTALVLALTTLLLLPVVSRRYGWRALLRVGRVRWRRICLIGLLSLLSYALVLSVYARAPVSYAGAVREVSIVFAALAGWRWLGEGFGALRAIGALTIFGGVLVIALVG